MRVREGVVDCVVPAESTDGVGEAVFYNPDQELNRDLTVALLRAHHDRRESARQPSYLDATAATGIRGVRAAAAGYDATLADRDPVAVEYCERNLAENDLATGSDAADAGDAPTGRGEAVHRDANPLMFERRFDVVDLDPFGTPMAFADAAVRSADELLCATATDTAPLCGAHFESGVRSYGAVPRNTEYHAEVGLRVLVSALVRVAARHDVALSPVVSFTESHYARTCLAVEAGARRADDALGELGYLHHCRSCLARSTERGLVAHPPAECPNCGAGVESAGPLWLGPLSGPEVLEAVRAAVTDDMGTADRARERCRTLAGEARLGVPTHFDQHRLSELWGRPAAPMDDFLAALREGGHRAVRTHYGGTTFKTDAPVDRVRDLTADLC
jgi:tRNA (guanine26-N2/guanine27-N2)-dimethyltransferase